MNQPSSIILPLTLLTLLVSIGSCQSAIPQSDRQPFAGFVRCGEAYVSTNIDPANCGGCVEGCTDQCGAVCAAGQSCDNGICATATGCDDDTDCQDFEECNPTLGFCRAKPDEVTLAEACTQYLNCFYLGCDIDCTSDAACFTIETNCASESGENPSSYEGYAPLHCNPDSGKCSVN